MTGHPAKGKNIQIFTFLTTQGVNPILVGILSDTHTLIHERGAAYLAELGKRYFADAEVILHAGDLVDPEILTLFAPKPVYAVRGNLDPPGLPFKRVLELGGKRIGLIHGWGALPDLEERVMREFEGESLDCLVYGHSHFPVCHQVDGLWLFNPGSPIDRRSAPFHSIGLLELDHEIRGTIIPVSGL